MLTEAELLFSIVENDQKQLKVKHYTMNDKILKNKVKTIV